jgi:hypothetical protein
VPNFEAFVLGSIVMGAGLIMAPVLPTRGPRIGLSAALALALVIVGALGYMALFGWDTLGNFQWLALLVVIFGVGTMSARKFRTKAAGGIKEYSGWPSPRELAFFLMVAILFAAPALILPVPLDTDAQGFGYLALTLGNGGSRRRDRHSLDCRDCHRLAAEKCSRSVDDCVVGVDHRLFEFWHT